VLDFFLTLSVLSIVLLVACAAVLVAFCSGHSFETAEIYALGENENFEDVRVREGTTEDEMEHLGMCIPLEVTGLKREER